MLKTTSMHSRMPHSRKPRDTSGRNDQRDHGLSFSNLAEGETRTREEMSKLLGSFQKDMIQLKVGQKKGPDCNRRSLASMHGPRQHTEKEKQIPDMQEVALNLLKSKLTLSPENSSHEDKLKRKDKSVASVRLPRTHSAGSLMDTDKSKPKKERRSPKNTRPIRDMPIESQRLHSRTNSTGALLELAEKKLSSKHKRSRSSSRRTRDLSSKAKISMSHTKSASSLLVPDEGSKKTEKPAPSCSRPSKEKLKRVHSAGTLLELEQNDSGRKHLSKSQHSPLTSRATRDVSSKSKRSPRFVRDEFSKSRRSPTRSSKDTSPLRRGPRIPRAQSAGSLLDLDLDESNSSAPKDRKIKDLSSKCQRSPRSRRAAQQNPFREYADVESNMDAILANATRRTRVSTQNSSKSINTGKSSNDDSVLGRRKKRHDETLLGK